MHMLCDLALVNKGKASIEIVGCKHAREEEDLTDWILAVVKGQSDV